MANVRIETSLDNLPNVYKSFADQIPYATSIALNDTAFGLMREEKMQMARHLDLKNTWTQRGQRVVKSTKYSLTANVGNTRWYMERLADGGTARPKIGIVHKGRRYLLMPNKDMRTSSGKLRKFKSKSPFVTKLGDELFLVYRKTKKRFPLQVVGRLVLSAEYQDDTYPHEEVAGDYIEKHWLRNWKKSMIKAARTAK